MEEKEVKMTPKVKEQPEKMSYEQLENVAHQLSEQNRQMYQQLQQANMTNIFKRLDYLFKVIENSPAFPADFIDKCVNEIMDLIIVPEETNTEN